MRIRASTGVRPVEYFGSSLKKNQTDMEFGAIDSSKAVTVEMQHDEKLKEGDPVHIQVALLHTSVNGQRKLRIHNFQMIPVSQYLDVYRGCDQDTIVNVLLKKAIKDSFGTSMKTITEGMIVQCVKILTTYRKYCSQSGAPGQLILPESLKLLPIYVNCSQSQCVESPGRRSYTTSPSRYVW